jgi:hypothetical protein
MARSLHLMMFILFKDTIASTERLDDVGKVTVSGSRSAFRKVLCLARVACYTQLYAS